MRKGEGWGGAGNLIAGIVEHLNEVDVDTPVGIDSIYGFFRAAEGAFDGLRGSEHGKRFHGCLDRAAEIAERMFGREAPGLGVIKRRATQDSAHLLPDQFKSPANRLFAFAQVTS